MQKLFNNILMPVRLDRRTDTAVSTAIAFANQLDCHLHLLFIQAKPLFSWFAHKRNDARRKFKAHELRERHDHELKKGLKLFSVFQHVDADSALSRYASTHDIDMVVVGEELKRYGGSDNHFSADWLADSMHCPVLTVKSYPEMSSFKTIVLPIEGALPINKIRVAVYLARYFEASIHLVAMGNSGSYEEMACMKRAFQVLKNNTDLPVVCNTLQGNDLRDIAFRYAQSVNAGLIMLNPASRPAWHGFLSKIWPGRKEEPKVPVITVG